MQPGLGLHFRSSFVYSAPCLSPSTSTVVFDCFDGTLIRYFKDVSNFKIESPQKPVLSIPQIIENIWQNIDRKYHSNVLVKRLRRIEKDMSGEARVQFAKWIPDGDIGKFAADYRYKDPA
jgi:type I restriction enzyme, R subunit